MRRGYDRETYLTKIKKLRQRIPEMLFGTDVIVGFPGETEEEFEQTLHLLDEVPFDTVYSFTYSERPGTRALDFGDDVPLAVKMEGFNGCRPGNRKYNAAATRCGSARGSSYSLRGLANVTSLGGPDALQTTDSFTSLASRPRVSSCMSRSPKRRLTLCWGDRAQWRAVPERLKRHR